MNDPTGEFDLYVTHFGKSDLRASDTGTDHLVREYDEESGELTTACGRTFHEREYRSGRTRQNYVSELSSATGVGNNACGNCPWDQIKASE